MNMRQYFTRSLGLIAAAFIVASAYAQAADDTAASKEKELIETLRSATPPEKALACKQLVIHGTKEAVPELAKLLPDEQLASWARTALEAIPDSTAGEALRNATDKLEGRLLIGAINSIGVRGDALAVDRLSRRLQDKDSEVASAAAVALGRIGDAAARKTLRGALASAPAEVRSAVAEGCILCAERLLVFGGDREAADIYDQVRQADVAKQRILEATRGAILARKSAGIALLIEQLKSPDKGLFQIALSVARELPGAEVANALAAELADTPPERAALLLYALGDRNDPLPAAVLEAARRGPLPVRIAAIGVVGHLGDASSLSTLLGIAVEDDAELAQSAKAAIAGLAGEKVDAAIADLLSKADGKALPLLIEVVGQRRINAAPALVKLVEHPDPAVRNAAVTALGATASPKELSVLIAQVVAPKYPVDAQAAQGALRSAAIRMPDREQCAAQLAAAMRGAPVYTKVVLLEILGAMGGTKALETIAVAAKENNDALQDTASRVLGEWMSVDAAPVLLDLAKDATSEKYQVRALRGYIRLARQFAMPDQERAEMCASALAAATRPDEQKLVLAVLERYPSADTLKVALKAAEVPALKEDATRIATSLSRKLGGNAADARKSRDKPAKEQ
jgi:HEAT repeat protein